MIYYTMICYNMIRGFLQGLLQGDALAGPDLQRAGPQGEAVQEVQGLRGFDYNVTNYNFKNMIFNNEHGMSPLWQGISFEILSKMYKVQGILPKQIHKHNK